MPRALIITAAGINCDLELAQAFQLAGATPDFVHLNQLLASPKRLERYELIGLPGGFSYGDAIAAGRIMAQLMRQVLYPGLVKAIERGVAIITPCNGFQIAAQLGLLPGPAPGEPWPDSPPPPIIALAYNASARFVDRWVKVELPADGRCVWTQGIHAEESTRLLPVAHGEGRFIPQDDDLLKQLEDTGQIAVRYAADDNPNGSTANVAGLCDASGLVLGLMPHPERFTRWTHHPWWTRLDESETSAEPLGLQMFHNAVMHARQMAAV